MKTFLIIILFLIILVIACMISYNLGVHNELHKLRDVYDNILRYSTYKEKFFDGLLYADKIIDIMDTDFNGDYKVENDFAKDNFKDEK